MTEVGGSWAAVFAALALALALAFDGLAFRFKDEGNFLLFGLSCDGRYRLLERVEGADADERDDDGDEPDDHGRRRAARPALLHLVQRCDRRL